MGTITYMDTRACARDFLEEERQARQYCAKWRLSADRYDRHDPIYREVTMRDVPLCGVAHLRHPDVPAWHNTTTVTVPVLDRSKDFDFDALKRRIEQTGELGILYSDDIGEYVIYQRVSVPKFLGFDSFYTRIIYRGRDEDIRGMKSDMSFKEYFAAGVPIEDLYMTPPKSPFRYVNINQMDNIFNTTPITKMVVNFIEDDGDTLQWHYSLMDADCNGKVLQQSACDCKIRATPSGWRASTMLRLRQEVQHMHDYGTEWFTTHNDSMFKASDYVSDHALRDTVGIIRRTAHTGIWLKGNSHTSWLRYMGKPSNVTCKHVSTSGRAGAVSTSISDNTEIFAVPDHLLHEPCVAYHNADVCAALKKDPHCTPRTDMPMPYELLLEHKQWMVLGFSRSTLSVTQLQDDGLATDINSQTDARWSIAAVPRVFYVHNEVWNTMRDRVFIHLAPDGFRFVFALATSMNIGGMAVNDIQYGPMVYTFSCFVPTPDRNTQIIKRGTPPDIRDAIGSVFGLSMALENALNEAKAQIARIPVNLECHNAMYDGLKLPIGHAIMSLGWGNEELEAVIHPWFGYGDTTQYAHIDAYPDGPNCVVRSTIMDNKSWAYKRARPVTRFVEHMRHTIRLLGDNRIVRAGMTIRDGNTDILQPVANRDIDLD